MSFNSAYETTHSYRFRKTLSFFKKHILPEDKILDLGVENPFSVLLKKEGYHVTNTKGEDLDLDIQGVVRSEAKVLSAFEIFEHMLSPLPLLAETKATKLIATVPIRLWFSPAYQSKTDPRDKHYHEFEDWQFDWLLEKAGWKIIDSEKWKSPTGINGIRPLLRNFTFRHYAVYAERI